MGTSCVRAPGGKKLLVGVGVVVRSVTPLMMAEAAEAANVLPLLLLLLAFSISGHRSPAQEFVGNVSGAATCTYVCICPRLELLQHRKGNAIEKP